MDCGVLAQIEGRQVKAEGTHSADQPTESEASGMATVVSMAFIVIAHVGVFAWQLVGVVRACDRYQMTEGTALPVYGAYLGIAIAQGVAVEVAGAVEARIRDLTAEARKP